MIMPTEPKEWKLCFIGLQAFEMLSYCRHVKLAALFDVLCSTTHFLNYTKCVAPNVLPYNTGMNIIINYNDRIINHNFQVRSKLALTACYINAEYLFYK
jgi:hypothetical protein